MQKSNPFAVILEERVEGDFWNAFLYYDNISVTLSQNFRSRFEFAVYKLSVSPYNYLKLTKRLRRIKLGKFPYMIVYKINNKTVTVLGFFHQASRPSKWRRL
jgi:hypothetical protein